MIIGRNNPRRNAIRILEVENVNVEAPPHSDQVPPLENDSNMCNTLEMSRLRLEINI